MLMKNVIHRSNIVSKVRKGLQNRYFPESGKFDSAKNRKPPQSGSEQDRRFPKNTPIFSPTQIKAFTIHPTQQKKKLLINLPSYL